MLKKKKKKNQLKSQFKSQRKKKSHKLQIQLFILMSVLVTNNPNVWNLNYFRIKFQKQQKILDNFVLEKKELAIVESKLNFVNILIISFIFNFFHNFLFVNRISFSSKLNQTFFLFNSNFS